MAIKYYVFGALALIAIGFSILFSILHGPAETPVQSPEAEVLTTPLTASTTEPLYAVIGTSVEGRAIESYTFGTGDTHLLFVGGVHGGYEWNSVLLAYEFIDYYTTNPQLVPQSTTITIIPSLNPDGVYVVTGKEGRFMVSDILADADQSAARFNANGVDLNRNFGCKWQPESTWRGAVVSAGTEAFSEPEAVALRDVVAGIRPKAVVFWHSQANAVYASECTEGVLPETLRVMDTYAAAARYTPVTTFDAYPITGDAEGWLASIGIPAVTVELSSHELVEWAQNLAGVTAVLGLYESPLELAR